MKYLSIVLFFISYHTFAQSQFEMNSDAADALQKSEKKLSELIVKIHKLYVSDTVFIKNFNQSQKIWIEFLGAEMLMKFPEREPGYYGSVQPLCWMHCEKSLIDERIAKLKLWTQERIEGEACNGSIGTF